MQADLASPSSDLADRQARLILDSATGYAIVGLDLAGTITSWNVGAERIMGWSAGDIVGRPAGTMFTPEDVAANVPDAEMASARERGFGTDERWHVRRDGSRFWANGELMPLRDEAGSLEGYVKILRDRTEQHRSAAALSESETRYQTLADAMEEGFCLIEVRCDDGAKPIDYRFLEVNAAFERQTGIPNAPGHWMRDLVPEHEQHWFDLYAKVALTGEAARFTLPAQAMNGRWYEVFAYRVGEPEQRQVAILFSDITERRMKEARLLASEESLRAANTELRNSQARLEALLRSSSQVLFSMNADWSAITDLSGNGFVAESAMPNADWMAEYVILEDRQKLTEEIGRAIETRTTLNSEHRIHRADGSVGWTYSRAVPIFDEAGTLTDWFGAATDTTEKHQADAELARADRLRIGLADLSERLRMVEDVEVMQIAASAVIGQVLGVGRVGYGSVADDGETFTVPNDWTAPSFPSLAGTYRISDYGAYADDLRTGTIVIIDDVTVDARTASDPAPLKAVSVGSLINYPVVEQGRTVAILYVNDADARAWRQDEIAFVREAGDRLRQATERRCAELALRDLNTVLEDRVEERTAAMRLYRDIVQSDASPTVAFDMDMRITAFNKAHSEAYRRVYGIEQRVGDSLLEQFVPSQVETVRGFMARALSGESFMVREAFGNPEIDVPNWQIAYNPLRDGEGRIIGGFHHALDITAELRVQEELDRTQDALRQSQKMEAIGQLTGGVAHDFNNLLTVIRGSVDLLRRDNVPAEKRQRYLDAIGDTADRATKLTGQLLAFSRRQTLEPETFDVAQRIDAITDMLDSITGARVLIRFDLPDETCRIRADVSQFETALVNLAVNARDAMDGEGKITITLRCGVKLPAIRGHGGSAEDFVAISLADTGTGIGPSDLERIFEPFFTTKEVGRGTGLGLSQVFGFAKQSGGDIDVQSVPREGSTFTLYLPAVEAETGEQKPAQVAPANMDGGGRCVLVVEDNISVGQFATQLLDDLGYRTEWVVNAEEALDRLGADGNGFDIVFSDVVMPGMGGVELARRLAHDLPDLPVVLASGYSHVLAQEGAEGFELLRKPYSANQLSAVLQRQFMTYGRVARPSKVSPAE